MTGKEMLGFGEDILRGVGIVECRQDAWILYSDVTGQDMGEYLMHEDDEISPETREKFRILIKKRAEHVPVQYILGHQSFMGIDFKVTPDVLIPRADTEVLVEKASGVLKDGMRVLDMCTGSGCILISLLYGRTGIEGMGCDISKSAINIARENAAANAVPAEFFVSDMFENVSGNFDMILSNPPYIAREQIADLMPEVRDFEPQVALCGGERGLDYYEIIAAKAPEYLNEGGRLFLEVGYDQADAVRHMLSDNGLGDIEITKDLAGMDRVVSAVYSEASESGTPSESRFPIGDNKDE